MPATYRPGTVRHPEAAAMARLQQPQAQPPMPQPAAQPTQAPTPPPVAPPAQPAAPQRQPMQPVQSFVPSVPGPTPQQPVQNPGPSQPYNQPPGDATAYYDHEAAKRDNTAALAANKAQFDASRFQGTPTGGFNMDSYNWMKRTYGY